MRHPIPAGRGCNPVDQWMTNTFADQVEVDVPQLRHEPLSGELRALYLNGGNAARREAAPAGTVDRSADAGGVGAAVRHGVGCRRSGNWSRSYNRSCGLRSCGCSSGGVGASIGAAEALERPLVKAAVLGPAQARARFVPPSRRPPFSSNHTTTQLQNRRSSP